MSLKRVTFLFLFLHQFGNLISSFAYPIALPNCIDTCGNTKIPYPFGIEPGCYRQGFGLTCNHTTNRTYLSFPDIEITNISIVPAELDGYLYIASVCYSSENVTIKSKSNYALASLVGLPYLFSSERNMFTVLGCDTVAFLVGSYNASYTSGCVTYCKSIGSASNGSCDGIGCCRASIPKELKFYGIYVGGGNITNRAWSYNPCNYAFLADKKWYNFSSSDLIGENFFNKLEDNDKSPVVLDWAIRDESCLDPTNPPEACKSKHSTCYNTTNGVGYLCNCSQGFEGNPYLLDGCQNINECDFPDKYPCKWRCVDTYGDYECNCFNGQKKDKYGTCTSKFPTSAKLAVGISVGLVGLFAMCFVIVLMLMRRTYRKEREAYFRKNGGQQLQELISQQVETIRVFSKTELEKATDNFKQVIGSGGRGMVCRGTLDNGRVVAVKRCKGFDEGQKEEFINEIVILSQINHRHVVRLVGCCLEVDIPMLVYEFISNGTLFDFLHGKNRTHKIPLDTRLRIARESAEALAFMHTTTNHPILHGDVKSLNILLDDEFNAKVSDFGASSLVPLDENNFVNFFQWTDGYVDPECAYTNHLTEKSDVFSFGVVILELITRKPAIYIDESGEQKKLLHSFHVIMRENRLVEILDKEIVNEVSMEILKEVADIALRCLQLSGEERPLMIEVAESLQMLMRSKLKHQNQEEIDETQNQEEMMSLFSASSPYNPSGSLSPEDSETTSILHRDIGR